MLGGGTKIREGRSWEQCCSLEMGALGVIPRYERGRAGSSVVA